MIRCKLVQKEEKKKKKIISIFCFLIHLFSFRLFLNTCDEKKHKTFSSHSSFLFFSRYFSLYFNENSSNDKLLPASDSARIDRLDCLPRSRKRNLLNYRTTIFCSSRIEFITQLFQLRGSIDGVWSIEKRLKSKIPVLKALYKHIWLWIERLYTIAVPLCTSSSAGIGCSGSAVVSMAKIFKKK